MPSAASTKSIQNACKKLTAYLKTLETVPVEELERSAQKIKAEAIAQTPYETGKLEASVYVRVSKDRSKPGLVAGASAKDKGYDYAAIQHEETSYEHPIKGKAHYISDPFNKEIANLKRRLKRRLKISNGR